MISPESEKIRSVRNRLKELCCSHGADYPGDGAGFSGKILEKETGLCFSDIDYSSALRSEWPAKQHLERLLRILANDGGVTEENRDLCLGLLDFWLNEDPVNPNWWHNEIGTPRLLGMAAASMYGSLSPERIMRVRGIMRRGSPRGNPKCAERAGANLIWGMVNTVYLAILEEDGEMIRFAAEKTASELIASDGIKDGIKPDMSFLQHKGINYTFGYGRSFVNELCRLLYILSGTDFMPEPDKIRLFEDFILEGCASFSLFGTADYQTVGREIARPGATSVSGFGRSLLLLCGLPEIGQREKIAAYAGEILSGTASRGTSSAVRAFPYSNMITAKSDGCYMSAKCSDTVFRCSEAGNGENYLGYNLFDGGTVCFMADGNEYSGAFPVWDYSLIPGVTTVYETDEELLSHTYSDGKWYSVTGRSDVRSLSVSGGGDALAGTLDACFLHGPVHAEIHRVLSEGRMLMTGKNISADCGETPSLQGRRIVTAVDQSALRENCPLSPGERTELGRGEAIVNGGFRYVNLCGLPLIAKAERRSGSFSRNNEELKGAPAAEADIFTVYYDHGPAESINGPDYACEIIRETRKNIGEW